MKFAYSSLWVAAALLVGCGGGSGGHRPAQAEPVASSPAPGASIALPPAPVPTLMDLRAPDGLDRSSSLSGPDANHDGIRDDINRWIDTQPYSQPEKNAVSQLALTVQRTLLVDIKDKRAARRVAEAVYAAIGCVRLTFEPKSPKPSQITSHLEAITANTKDRAMQYIRFNSALDGMVFELPETPTCD